MALFLCLKNIVELAKQFMPEKHEPYVIYKKIIQRVMLNPEGLPALPSVTLKIRAAVANSDTSNDDIAVVCGQDPSFSALIMANVGSAIFHQANPPRTLESAVSVLGRERIQSLVMAYSVKSLFVIRSPEIKKLYQNIWQRMMLKSSTAAFLATKVPGFQAEEVLLSSLLTEVGTLATLTAFSEFKEKPSQAVFFRLCREYAKAFGAVLLKKWELDERFITCLKNCGRWTVEEGDDLGLTDILNLGLYSTVRQLSPKNNLPQLEKLPSFQKLPIHLKRLSDEGELLIVQENRAEIDSIKRVLA